jgi:hypothetical protein
MTTTAAASTTTPTAGVGAHTVEHSGLYFKLELVNVTETAFLTRQHLFEQLLSKILFWPRHLVKTVRVNGAQVESTDSNTTDSIGIVPGVLDESPSDGPTHCMRFNVLGFADSAQSQRSGAYYFTHNTWGNRPVYKSLQNEYLYFHPQKQWWLIGPNLGSSVAGMVASSEVASPDLIPTGDWYVYDDKIAQGWRSASSVHVSCDPVPFVSVSVQLQAQGCDDADRHALAQSKLLLTDILAPSQPTTGLVHELRAHNMYIMTAAMQGQAVVRDCAPVLLVDLPHPHASHSLQVHCHYDGTKVHVVHKRPMTHSSFNCYHRFAQARNVWDCNCHSWDPEGEHGGLEFNNLTRTGL